MAGRKLSLARSERTVVERVERCTADEIIVVDRLLRRHITGPLRTPAADLRIARF